MATLEGIAAALDRIERNLNALLKALADDEDPASQPSSALDGTPAGQERDQTQSLG